MHRKLATFLDSNAGAPLHPQVKAALFAFFAPETQGDSDGVSSGLNFIANPSSVHQWGRKTKTLLTKASEQVARSLGATVKPEQLLWTSCGTESNHTAIREALSRAQNLNPSRDLAVHWITGSTEHSATRKMVEISKNQGLQVDLIPVLPSGQIDLSVLEEKLRPETALVSVIWANNETGVINPVAELISLVRTQSKNALIHLDGAQIWGKLPLHDLDLNQIGADFVSFSAHKIGAPAGVGLLWAKDPSTIRGVVLPGTQEKGRRGGTENAMGRIAAGAAAQAIVQGFSPERIQRVKELRDRLEGLMLKNIPKSVIHGAGTTRVCNTLSIGFKDIDGTGLVQALDLEGFGVSGGSACASGIPEPSPVLLAMGVEPKIAGASLRISFFPPHFDFDPIFLHSEVDRFVKVMVSIIGKRS